MRWLLTIAGLFLFTLNPARAHHAFAAEFDSSKPVRLTGTISKVAWLNPHARFTMKVRGGPNASSVSWEVVLASPNVLIRQGWDRKTLQDGAAVDINGYAARGGLRIVSARTVRLPGGRTMVFGSGGDGGPEK